MEKIYGFLPEKKGRSIVVIVSKRSFGTSGLFGTTGSTRFFGAYFGGNTFFFAHSVIAGGGIGRFSICKKFSASCARRSIAPRTGAKAKGRKSILQVDRSFGRRNTSETNPFSRQDAVESSIGCAAQDRRQDKEVSGRIDRGGYIVPL